MITDIGANSLFGARVDTGIDAEPMLMEA